MCVFQSVQYVIELNRYLYRSKCQWQTKLFDVNENEIGIDGAQMRIVYGNNMAYHYEEYQTSNKSALFEIFIEF